MKRKLIIFLIFFLIFVGIIALSFVSKPITNLPNNQVGSNAPVKPPQISTFYPDKGITYKVNVNSFTPPKELPLIKINPPRPLTESEVLKVAKAAGLKEDEYNKIFTNDNQRLYIFNSNNAYLTVYADRGELSYKNYEKLTNPETKLSDDEIISKAKDFLSSKFSFRLDSLSLSSIDHFNNEDYLTLKGPTQPRGYFEVNFAPVITVYKVVTTKPDQSPIKVTVADDGTIGKADITLVYRATLSTEKYGIKSFSELKDQIKNAVIVQAYTEDLHGQSFPTDSIESIDINNIEIAYLADSTLTSNYYQPIFLLEGTGKSRKISYPIKITLYLPALKNDK